MQYALADEATGEESAVTGACQERTGTRGRGQLPRLAMTDMSEASTQYGRAVPQ